MFVGILISFIGAIMIGFGSMMMFRLGYCPVWGIKVEYPTWLRIAKIAAVPVMILGFIVWFYSFGIIMEEADLFDLMAIFGPIIGLVVGMFVGVALTDILTAKKLTASKNAQALGTLPVMQAIDAEIPNCHKFHLCTQGVLFYDDKNYCYTTIRFSDYQLGDLSTPKEVWGVCTYLCQKHSPPFRAKGDSPVTRGSANAGEAIGNMIAGSQVTGYIFTRK